MANKHHLVSNLIELSKKQTKIKLAQNNNEGAIMKASLLITSIFVFVSFISAAADPQPQNHQNTNEAKTGKVGNTKYMYGYTRKEIHSIPKISVSGYDNPELIEEYKAWAFFLRISSKAYESNRDDAWYMLRRISPSMNEHQLDLFIRLAQEALYQASFISAEVIDSEFTLCDNIIKAAKSKQKLTNKKIKQMLNHQAQKLPLFYKQVIQELTAELSPAIVEELEPHVLNKIRMGISYSELDVDGLANLRNHQHSYSDLYQGVFCPAKMKFRNNNNIERVNQ